MGSAMSISKAAGAIANQIDKYSYSEKGGNRYQQTFDCVLKHVVYLKTRISIDNFLIVAACL